MDGLGCQSRHHDILRRGLTPQDSGSPLRMVGRLVGPIVLAAAGLLTLALAGWAVGWAVMRTLQPVDFSIVQWAAEHRSPGLTFLMHRLSDLAGEQSVVLGVAVAAGLLVFARRWADAIAVVGSAAGTLFLYEGVVRWVGRPRPAVPHLENPGGSSFPSGHVANSTALYVAILLVVFATLRRHELRAAAVALAALLIVGIAASRVYLGLHYPSDVVAGFLLGGAWASIMRRSADAFSTGMHAPRKGDP